MAATRANQNRKIRQDALREQLANQKLVEKVIDSINELDKLTSDQEGKDRAAIIKTGIDARLRLISKYLPDLKSTEITGDSDNPVVVSQPVTFTDPE